MRAVWVTAEPPDRNLGGGSIRQSHLLEALARAAETQLVMLGPLEDEALREVVTAVTELPPVPPMAWRTTVGRRLHDLVHALGGRDPHEVVLERARRARLGPVVGALAPADVVVLSHGHLAPLAPLARARRRVADFQTVPSRNVELSLPFASGARQRWLLERDLTKARRFEAGICHRVDVAVAVSDADAACLAPCAVVVPNGVDLERYVPTPLPAEHRLVMTGTFAFGPNVDGATWFCSEVLPLVRAAVPDVRVDLVGRLPRDEVLALAAEHGVAVHADVVATEPFLRRARVAVVPIRMGAGTRLKAVEAMAAGRPVVGTTLGLEGLGVVDRQHGLVADGAGPFAEAVCAALLDDDLARRLAAAGRAHVESHFGWDALGGRFVDAVLGGMA